MRIDMLSVFYLYISLYKELSKISQDCQLSPWRIEIKKTIDF